MLQPLFEVGQLIEKEQAKQELYALLNEGLSKFGEENIEELSVFSFNGECKEIQGGNSVSGFYCNGLKR